MLEPRVGHITVMFGRPPFSTGFRVNRERTPTEQRQARARKCESTKISWAKYEGT